MQRVLQDKLGIQKFAYNGANNAGMEEWMKQWMSE